MYFYTGAPNWVFSMFSFIAFLISVIPLPWHLEAWNVGTCMFMLWSGFANLVLFIDSIIWNGNMIDWSPTWCDISTHFLNGFNLAIPACSLCINRRLYQIASVRTVTKSRSAKRKAIAIDLCIALGIPVLQIPLQYVVQGHRYNIYEDVGCLGETFETPVAVVLYHLPPIIVGLVSGVYCILSIKNFYRSRAQFKEFLGSSNSNLNLNRYIRLMCLASTDLFLTVPLGIYTLWVNAKVFGIAPWISWEDTHSNFSRVVQFPGIEWRADPFSAASLESARWLTVGCAIMFFAYFGFADEAMKNYRFAFTSVAKRVGYSTATQSSSGWTSAGSKKPTMSSTGRSATLPVFIRKETSQKRDSLDSVSDLSASYGALDYNTDKSVGALSLGDIEGVVPDYKESDYSSPESSSSSSGSSAGSPTRIHTPEPADPVLPPHQMV
ncbi:pheromone B alpha 1 receptor [Roridomyces roridus]|uniref:Pheromone B alpha 1 receptor n=1 Tax=Roridomyces roridus TaxID=1738132 RepID=A0AAD7BI25_9AGAR|nr:pheromone B alpha 1 receptor [Roridomyces roridus]